MTRGAFSRWKEAAAAVALLAAVPAVPAAAEDRALLVGVGRHQLESANLPGIDKDLAMMREVLASLGFRPPQIRVLADEQATLANIRREFQGWLVDGVNSGERAVFYFTGHGSRMQDRNNDEPDRLDEILIPHDFQPTGGDPKNVLLDDELGALLGKLRTNRVLVFIDACHSGTATKSLGDMDKWLPYEGMPNLPETTTLDRAKDVNRINLDVGDKNPGAANYIAVAAADDAEQAQASAMGSYFTIGVHKAVTEAVKAGRPLSMLDIKNVSTRDIAERATKPHHPQISGALTRIGENVLGPTPSSPPPGPPSTGGSLWAALEGVADRVPPGRRLAVTANNAEYRERDLLELSFDVAVDGYLNVLNLGDGQGEATVLFPNKYHANHKVAAGTRVRVPGGRAFKLPARLPAGRSEQRNLVVVLLTQKPLNAYELGGASAVLEQLDGPETREFVVEAASGDYFAGKVIITIRR